MLLGDSRRTIHARSPHPISPHPAPLDLTTNPPLTSSRAPTPKTFSTPPRLGYSVVTRHLLPPGYSVFCMRPQAAGLFSFLHAAASGRALQLSLAAHAARLFGCCRRPCHLALRLSPAAHATWLFGCRWRHVRPSYSIVARASGSSGLFGCCPACAAPGYSVVARSHGPGYSVFLPGPRCRPGYSVVTESISSPVPGPSEPPDPGIAPATARDRPDGSSETSAVRLRRAAARHPAVTLELRFIAVPSA